MNSTTTCLLAGLALGFAAAFGGFAAFVVVLFLGATGFVVGRVLDGEPVLSVPARRGRR
ncbi:hypothetical protein GCM10022243_42600 [Saccharothrix violaceirubra]|uniref:Small integral membrane protein DUF2273 n=1 Tax=Saccharothrix violaceirubra TaxID=413306 RepID=A0A7W7T2V1_9PSEU|nr:hypothetical protein [Saccharothrix violaceirubra]MBB4965549.1 hypothetical protein [Saccharothrix violaceirubra]